MEKKKICMFFNDLAVYRRAIYKMLDEEYDCEWYIEDVNTGVKEFDASELKRVHRLPVRKRGSFYTVKGFLKLLRQDFDVYFVLGATRNFTLFVFCVLKRLFYPDKRVYFWTHGLYGKETKAELLLWKIPFFKLANGIFTYGEYSKGLLIKNGINPEKVFVIHNSLSYDEQLELRNSLTPTNIYNEHFGNSLPVLVMIGRLNGRKHLDMLFHAVAILKEKGEGYNIILIGDGECKESLIQLARDKGLEKQVWFYGACYDEKTNAELLFNSDMCVVPGDTGLTAIHSLMFGVPVVTHNCFKYQGPEFEAIKSGITGDYYEYGSIENLAAIISSWFKNHNREEVRNNCYKEIDTLWNPIFQYEVVKKHLV